MRQYQITENGCLLTPSGQNVPKQSEFSGDSSGRLWQKARDEVESDEAEILPYVEPSPTIGQQIAELETTVTDRNIRAAMLGDQYAIDHLQSVEDQIAALRT